MLEPVAERVALAGGRLEEDAQFKSARFREEEPETFRHRHDARVLAGPPVAAGVDDDEADAESLGALHLDEERPP